MPSPDFQLTPSGLEQMDGGKKERKTEGQRDNKTVCDQSILVVKTKSDLEKIKTFNNHDIIFFPVMQENKQIFLYHTYIACHTLYKEIMSR